MRIPFRVWKALRLNGQAGAPAAAGAPPRARQGSVLFAALTMVGVVGLALAGYLSLIQSRAAMASRSQTWNLCVPVGEAGLEEAMAHLNYTRGVGLGSNGWTLVSARGAYVKQSSLATGSYYIASISTNTAPVVESVGLVQAPSHTNYIFRRFRITTRLNPAAIGLVARGQVTVQGNAYTDSYDSSDPLASTNGAYTPGKARQNGFLGSLSTGAGDLMIKDNSDVVGAVGTVNSNVLSMTSPASVGDLAYVGNGANGGKVQAGHRVTGLSVPIPTEAVPAGTYIAGTPSWGAVGGTNYDLMFNNTNYRVANFTLDSQKAVVVGRCVLHVTENFYAQGSASIYITPGSTLDLYVGLQFYAQGTSRINTGGRPEQFTYHGLPGNVQAYIQDSAILVGTFSAPNAKMDMNATAQLWGAGLCNELVFQGDAKFHYDESLGLGLTIPYEVVSWTEL